MTDTASLSRRRNVSYRTSKKANITIPDKTKKPHRAIKHITDARNLTQFIHA